MIQIKNKMFNNPLRKYQSGGNMATPEQQQQIAKLFEDASKNTGIDVETLTAAANEMKDEQSMKQYVEAISLAAQGNLAAINSIKKMFGQKQAAAFAKGGKLWNFICKHAKGGVVDCGCDKKVAKGEDGLPDIGDHSPRPASINVPTIPGLIAEFRQHKVADSGNATNRNFSKVNWRGNQYFLERANIDGNIADTWIQVTPQLDTLVEQTLPSGRITPLTIEQAQSIVDRNRADINKQENGGVVKGQSGIPEGIPIIFNKPITQTVSNVDSDGKPREIRRIIDSGDTTIFVPFGSSKKPLRISEEMILKNNQGNGYTRQNRWYNRYNVLENSKKKNITPEFWKSWNQSIDNKLK